MNTVQTNLMYKNIKLNKDSRILLIAFKACILFTSIIVLINDLYSLNHLIVSFFFLFLKSNNIHKTYAFIVMYYIGLILIITHEIISIFLLIEIFTFCTIFLMTYNVINFKGKLNVIIYYIILNFYTTMFFYVFVIILLFFKGFIFIGPSESIVSYFFITSFILKIGLSPLLLLNSKVYKNLFLVDVFYITVFFFFIIFMKFIEIYFNLDVQYSLKFISVFTIIYLTFLIKNIFTITCTKVFLVYSNSILYFFIFIILFVF